MILLRRKKTFNQRIRRQNPQPASMENALVLRAAFSDAKQPASAGAGDL